MGRIITRFRGSSSDRSEARAVLSGAHGVEMPPRFAPVGDVLASDPAAADTPAALAACDAVGRDLARDGVALDEALDGLHRVTLAVTGREPTYGLVRALAAGWSDETLGYLRQLSCEDPLTGLATVAHLRSRLSELYRDQALTGRQVQDSHVLVVLETPAGGRDGEVFGTALRTARLAETARTVFPGGHTMGRVGPERVALLAHRDGRLGRRVGVLRNLLSSLGPQARTWLQALPLDDDGVPGLLADLARS